jgi:myo-inositol-1(or 4)-monophosphatase
MQQRARTGTAAARPESIEQMTQCLTDWVQAAGQILLDHFGQIIHPRQKESASSVVCDADLASEKFLVQQIRARFPSHNVISEECGAIWTAGRYTWVLDPLDGTSNFVAGLPWFGVQIGVLDGEKPIMAAMFLPTENRLYFARAGGGATRNGEPVLVTQERQLDKVLCAFGFDPAPARRDRARIGLLFRVSRAVRNTRATNSLIDFCYTVDGRLGGCINLKTKIWDIVPVSVILPEAGGKFTDLNGKKIRFRVDDQSIDREFAVLASSRQLHSSLVCLTKDPRSAYS